MFRLTILASVLGDVAYSEIARRFAAEFARVAEPLTALARSIFHCPFSLSGFLTIRFLPGVYSIHFLSGVRSASEPVGETSPPTLPASLGRSLEVLLVKGRVTASPRFRIERAVQPPVGALADTREYPCVCRRHSTFPGDDR